MYPWMKGYAGAIKTVGKFMATASRSTLRNPEQMRNLAKASTKLYGGLTVATYGTRLMRGRHILKNRKGRVDIAPGVPFI